MLDQRTMLSHQEQRTWDDIRRRWVEEAPQPARQVLDRTVRRRSAEPVGLLAAVVAVAGLAVLLVIVGAPIAGLALAVATVPRWLLWRCWPLLDGGVSPSAPAAIRVVALDDEGASSAPGQ